MYFFFSVLVSDTYFGFVLLAFILSLSPTHLSDPKPHSPLLFSLALPYDLLFLGVSTHLAWLLVLPHSFLPGKPLFQLCEASSAASPAPLVPLVLITSATVSTSPVLLSSEQPCWCSCSAFVFSLFHVVSFALFGTGETCGQSQANNWFGTSVAKWRKQIILDRRTCWPELKSSIYCFALCSSCCLSK